MVRVVEFSIARVGVDQGGQGWSESPLRGWGSQGWSNFVGERAGSISEGRIRSSKSGRWLGWSDSVWERLRLVRGVRNRSYMCQAIRDGYAKVEFGLDSVRAGC